MHIMNIGSVWMVSTTSHTKHLACHHLRPPFASTFGGRKFGESSAHGLTASQQQLTYEKNLFSGLNEGGPIKFKH
jgi:hypothetical protein